LVRSKTDITLLDNVSDMFQTNPLKNPNYLINMASPRGFEPLLPP
jgi:hypothetical protein